jgi:hypothetical protein
MQTISVVAFQSDRGNFAVAFIRGYSWTVAYHMAEPADVNSKAQDREMEAGNYLSFLLLVEKYFSCGDYGRTTWASTG